VRDVAELYGYEPIRYLMISSHYRSPINYNYDIVEQSKASLNRLYTCRESLDFALNNAEENASKSDADILALFDRRRQQFVTAMDDDLNTADGLSAVFELVRDINTRVIDAAASVAICKEAARLLDELCGVLGILYNRKTDSLDERVGALIAARTAARRDKDWAKADAIRDELKAMGVLLEDTPQGIKWRLAE
jgi:cysteinyl-tRNA synthetase